MSYLVHNDGDLGLARAVWCLTRHLRATRVVETGVAHGVTSRFVLEALARNGGGHLWSIDLPPTLHPEMHGEIGLAVGEGLRGWTYIRGSSRRRLPGLLKRVAPIDLFIHDSRHTTENVLFEVNLAWRALRPGGALVVDDIDTNTGFDRFCEAVRPDRVWVCEAEPVRADERRANRKGYFGVVLKPGVP
jgi:predicted O-methyltransferase YrrM